MSHKAENVLKAVYRQRGEGRQAPLDPDWRTSVLRQIRTQRADAVPPSMWLFQQYLWRLAPVACALILAMGVWVTRTGLNPELDLVALSLDNPVSVNLIASFGM